jgi:hypothetical protein
VLQVELLCSKGWKKNILISSEYTYRSNKVIICYMYKCEIPGNSIWYFLLKVREILRCLKSLFSVFSSLTFYILLFYNRSVGKFERYNIHTSNWIRIKCDAPKWSRVRHYDILMTYAKGENTYTTSLKVDNATISITK